MNSLCTDQRHAYVTLTVDFGEVAERPDCPVLDLRRITTAQQTQNRLKWPDRQCGQCHIVHIYSMRYNTIQHKNL